MTIFLWILFTVGGFLLGSLMFCKMIPKLLLHKDICELSDDHNPGAFNVFKHCGKTLGIICLLLDVLKGFVPVLLAYFFLNTETVLFAFVIVAPVFGHALGMFNCFHGGKCIAVSFGVTLGILPVTWIPFVILAVLYILFSTVIKINPNSKRSIIVYSLFGVSSCIVCAILGMTSVAIGCVVVAITAIIKHLKNFQNVQAGKLNGKKSII